MSAAYWRALAQKAIAEALETIPADADTETRRKAISKNYPLHERSHYPYLIWRQEVQKYFGTYKPSESDRLSHQRYMAKRVKVNDMRKIEAYEKATGKKFPT